MDTLFSAYSDFYYDGDYANFKDRLSSLSSSFPKDINPRDMPVNYRDAIVMIAKYLEVYGVNVNFINKSYSAQNIVDILNTGKNYMRIIVTTEDIDNLVNAMCSENEFPQISYGEFVEFNGAFNIPLDIDNLDIHELMWDAATLYLYGFPIRKEWTKEIISNIKRVYTRAETLSQAMIYISMCDEWMQKAICEMTFFGITVNQWCASYDSVLYDISKQNNPGFVFIKNPRDKDSVVCISKIYVGKFFTVSSRIFNIMYECGIFNKIRFTDRVVPVRIVSDGTDRVVDRMLNVPVYSDDEHNEKLVSEIASDDFIYHEVFVNDVGKGY